MIFFLFRIMQRLACDIKGVLLRIAQFSIGFFLLALSINMWVGVGSIKSGEIYQQSSIKRISWVQMRPGEKMLEKDQYSGFTISDYFSIKSAVFSGKSSLLYAVSYTVPSLRNGTSEYIEVLFVDEEVFRTLGEVSPLSKDLKEAVQSIPENTITASPELLASIRQAEHENRIRSLIPNALCNNMLTLKTQEDNVPTTIVIPLSLWPEGSEETTVFCYLLPGSSPIEDMVPDLFSFMYQRHPQSIDYYLMDIDEKIDLPAQRAFEDAQSLLIISLIVIISVSVGMIGAFLKLLDSRREEFSILICLGVPRKRLVLELFAEEFSQLGTSAFIGSIVGVICLPRLSSEVLELGFHGFSIGFPLLISLLLCTFLSMIAVKSIRGLQE